MSKRHTTPSPYRRRKQRVETRPMFGSDSLSQPSTSQQIPISSQPSVRSVVSVPKRRKQRVETRPVFGSDSISQPIASTSQPIPSTSQPKPVTTTITPVYPSVGSTEPKSRKQSIAIRYDPNTEPHVEFNLIDTLDTKYNKKFRATEQWSRYEIRHNLSEFPDLMAIQSAIDAAYNRVMKPYLQGLAPDDMIGGYIEHEALQYSIAFRPIKKRLFDEREFLNRIYCTSQSKQRFLLDGTLIFRVVTYKHLSGSGRGKLAPLSYTEADSKKKSIIKIRNREKDEKDNTCGYRALVMGVRYHEWGVRGHSQQKRWKNLLDRDSAQVTHMTEFCMDYQLDPREPLNTAIIQDLDSRLDYQIVVIKDCKPVFKGTDRPKTIYLLHTENPDHFDLITTMTGYTKSNFYCKVCNRGYTRAAKHRCDTTCFYCRSSKLCLPSDKVQCRDCLVTFLSPHCYANHKNLRVCADRHYCPHCEVIYNVNRKRQHRCNELHCITCGEYYTVQPHHCFMSPLDSEKIAEEDHRLKIFIAFDIECMLEKTGDSFTHTPILLIRQTVCDTCLSTGFCDLCGDKEQVFYGTDCVQSFAQYLLDFSKIAEQKKASITVFAHNSSGYDGHWLLREFANRNIKGLDGTLNGTKIMKLDAGNIRIIDSLLLFQRPLSDLPKMFGLTGEVKGFFPHYLNTSENQNLSLCLCQIPTDKFGRQHMTHKKATEFDKWYETNGRMVYNLKEEMIRYCRSDVSILLKAMISFRKLFIETTGVDPLTRCFTLASIGLEFFRAKLLPANTIGITPIGGYNNYRKQSMEANAWLDIQEDRWGPIIREYKIGRFYADGVCLQTIFKDHKKYSMIAFEFNGCKWHGHDCGKNYDKQKFEAVSERKKYFEKMGAYPVFIWECDWHHMASKKYFKRLRYHIKMAPKEVEKRLYCDPRRALHGGRTNNLKFTWTAGPNETIRYLDFTSLYPYVLSRRSFPGGHPYVYRQNFPTLDSVFGFVSCKVLPPTDLYLPVLPFTSGGKLTFPLCRTCAEKRLNESCPHSKEERSFTGVFVSVELQKAMALGYEVLEVYEVLHYDRQITDVFREYVNRWYKIKAEASGFPANCQTNEEKVRFLTDFERIEGFALDPTKIQSNPGLRTTAKLMLNSFWGKLAQRPDLPITQIVKEREEMYNLFNDSKIEILGDVILDQLMLISYKYKDITECRVGNTSVAIAAFVTAYARLKLYDEMEKIESSSPDSVLYFDTDSIIFVHKPGHYSPTIGNFLGQMTDEIAEEYGTEARLIEFHSIGPKTYALKVDTPSGPKHTLKAKGLSQTIQSSTILNFDRIRQMAQNTANSIPSAHSLVPQHQFRTTPQHIVSSVDLKKRFDITSEKRRVIGNDTLPYGFVDPDSNTFADIISH